MLSDLAVVGDVTEIADLGAPADHRGVQRIGISKAFLRWCRALWTISWSPGAPGNCVTSRDIVNGQVRAADITVLVADGYHKSQNYESIRHLPLPGAANWLDACVVEIG